MWPTAGTGTDAGVPVPAPAPPREEDGAGRRGNRTQPAVLAFAPALAAQLPTSHSPPQNNNQRYARF